MVEKRTDQSTVSEKIARFLTSAKFESLPAPVIQKAKEQIVFFFGRAFEGLRSPEGRQVHEMARNMAQTGGGVTVIAEPFRLLPSDAAFANCSLMRGALGRDDVIWPAGIHAGVITLPTALALAEQRHATGKDLLLALIVGYEVLGKLGRASDPWRSRLPRRPTNVYGSFGPITVAGSLLKLDEKKMSNALGYAANLNIGIAEGGMMDHYYSLINRNGLLAALLAGAGGAPYSPATIEGNTGFFRSFFGEVPPDLNKLVDALGSNWEILTAEQKRYPGTGQNTVAVELLLHLLNEKKLGAQQIAKVNVFQVDYQEQGDRKHDIVSQGPFTLPVKAYSSAPYALALVILEGKIPLGRYQDDADFNDKAVAMVMRKINVFFEKGRSPRYCRIEVYTTDNQKFVRETDNFLYPFFRDVWEKWLQNAGAEYLSREQLKHLEMLVADLENVGDVSELMKCVLPEGGRENA